MTVTCRNMLHMLPIIFPLSKIVHTIFMSLTHQEEGEIFRSQWDIELIEHLIMNDMCDDDWKNGNDCFEFVREM